MANRDTRNRAGVSVLTALACVVATVACGNDQAAPEDGGSVPTEVRISAYVEGSAQNLPLVAAQDGDGAWTAVTGRDGVYSLSLKTGRYGLAHVCDKTEGPLREVSVTLSFFTAAEEPAPVIGCVGTSGGHEVSGTVFGLNGDAASISIRNQTVLTTGLFSIEGVPEGTHDIVAVHLWPDWRARRIIIRRDWQITSDTNMSFNFDAEGGELSSRPGELSAAKPAETTLLGTVFIPSQGGAGSILLNKPDEFAFVPVTLLRPNDIHRLIGTAVDASMTRYRGAEYYRHTPADQDLTLPPAFDSQVSATQTGAQVEYRVRFASAEDSAAFACTFAAAAPSGLQLTWNAQFGAHWLGAAGDHDIVLPALAALPGWNADWNPLAGVPTAHACYEFRTNRLADLLRRYGFEYARLLPNSPGLDGFEVQWAGSHGVLTP